MTRWHKQMYLLAHGGVTLALIDGIANVNFNSLWFQFLSTIFNLIALLLTGGNPSTAGSNNFFG